MRLHISNKREALEISERLGLTIPFYKSYEVRGTFSEFLFAGIMTNWNEYRFYRRTKNPFLMPSYFSLFGLFNIQRKAEKIAF